MTLAFVSSPLDRAHALRTKPEAVAALRQRADAKIFRVRGDAIEMRGDFPEDSPRGGGEADIFLGLANDGSPAFATQADAGAPLEGLRSLMLKGLVSPETLSLLAQARSLIHWHERHGFCANCGTKTLLADSGYRRTCPACAAEHFPRTDPVAIIAVRRPGHVLLGRQASWNQGMYSALAGFIEPGETIEQGARREVFEEAGIHVGDVRYVASQPWPFPSSLMIGLVGEAESTEITVDTSELEEARWFSTEEVRLMLARQHPGGLYATHPYAIAHQITLAALQPG